VSIFWAYLRFRLATFVLRAAGWLLLIALLAAVLAAAAPVTLVAAAGLAGAWLRGLAAVAAVAGRRLVTGDDPCVSDRRCGARHQLAGVRAGSGA
jgi:hypothetical protein